MQPSWIEELNRGNYAAVRQPLRPVPREKEEKPLLVDLISTGTGTLGAIGGGLLGSLAGPVGTVGAGIAGGSAGSAFGEWLENKIMGEEDQFKNVGLEAVLGGVTALPLGATLKVGQAGLKAGTGLGRTGVRDLLEDAGRRTVGTQGTKEGVSTAATTGNKRSIGGRLEQAGNRLLGSQANLTRAEARRVGQLPEDVLGEINRRTGLSRMDDMADVSKNVTGSSGVFNELTNNALGNTPGVDLGDLRRVGEDLMTNQAPLITGAQRKGVLEQIKNSAIKAQGGSAGTINPLANPLEARAISDNFKKLAADISKRPTVSAADSQLASVYRSLAKNIDDKLYAAPGLDEGLKLARGDRAMDLRRLSESAPNRAQATAYQRLADEIEQISSVPALRSAQRPFVGLGQIDEATARATQGAGAQLGDQMQGLGRIAQRPTNIVAMPLNAATPMVGSGLARAGRALQGIGQATGGAARQGGQRLPGVAARQGGGRLAASALGLYEQEPSSLEDALAMSGGEGMAPGGIAPGDAAAFPGAEAMQQPANPFGYTLDEVAAAIPQAMAAGDKQAVSDLTDLYALIQDYEASAAESMAGPELTATQQSQAVRAQNALNDVQTLLRAIESGDINKTMIPFSDTALVGNALGTTDTTAALFNIGDVILRSRTGAAAPAEEIRKFVSGFLPRAGESKEAQMNKLMRAYRELEGMLNPPAALGAGTAVPDVISSQPANLNQALGY